MPNNYFPNNPGNKSSMDNPAIQLFGNRLFMDQTVSELLVEFFLVALSPKRIGNQTEFKTALPEFSTLSNWEEDEIAYAPMARLNLKLFSFLGASRIESRHTIHRNHYRELRNLMAKKIRTSSDNDKDEIIHSIEDLFVGFQGAGRGRTWCAQSFLPVSENFLTGETIWSEKSARKLTDENWLDVFTYFKMNQHAFLARGGELIYLQLCNALTVPQEDISHWCKTHKVGFTDDEQNPLWLHQELGSEFDRYTKQGPNTLNKLAEFVDTSLDRETSFNTDQSGDIRRFVTTGWCNRYSEQNEPPKID
ncbi:MAG: hypothetical protein HN757_17510 [Calditrichaeota bacterium]|nr:hypothetical protein [Calditrichota bacterium]